MRLLKLDPNRGLFFKRTSIFAAMAAALTLTACASAPQLPNEEIRFAEDAINRAEEARVADYASADLRAAREKLTRARDLSNQAASNKNAEAATSARRLAEQAKSDAELAVARAQEARAKEANKEIKRNIDALDNALQRQGGTQ